MEEKEGREEIQCGVCEGGVSFGRLRLHAAGAAERWTWEMIHISVDHSREKKLGCCKPCPSLAGGCSQGTRFPSPGGLKVG